MNHDASNKYILPTVLVVSNNQTELISDSSVLPSIKQVYMSLLESAKILPWVQQYQPDLIVLDLASPQIINLQLIAALRLDWLTRNIPIMILAGSTPKQIELLDQLDYNAFLIKPYSPSEFGKKICSLVSTPACEIFAR